MRNYFRFPAAVRAFSKPSRVRHRVGATGSVSGARPGSAPLVAPFLTCGPSLLFLTPASPVSDGHTPGVSPKPLPSPLRAAKNPPDRRSPVPIPFWPFPLMTVRGTDDHPLTNCSNKRFGNDARGYLTVLFNIRIFNSTSWRWQATKRSSMSAAVFFDAPTPLSRISPRLLFTARRLCPVWRMPCRD